MRAAVVREHGDIDNILIETEISKRLLGSKRFIFRFFGAILSNL